MANKALIIEDDVNIVELVQLEVGDLGYELDSATDGVLGVEMATSDNYAFVLLDIMLPELEGVEVLKQIRAVKPNMPVLMLTARTDDTSKVLLLELGADDFISKPFNPLELKARIKAVLRRNARSADSPTEVFRFKDLEVDLSKRRVSVRGEEVVLTATEYEILAFLMANPGKPLTRGEINNALYGHDVFGYEKSISSHINRIRTKIEVSLNDPEYILTVRGVGYCFSDKEE